MNWITVLDCQPWSPPCCAGLRTEHRTTEQSEGFSARPGPAHIWLDFCSFRTSFLLGWGWTAAWVAGGNLALQNLNQSDPQSQSSHSTVAIQSRPSHCKTETDRPAFNIPSWVGNYIISQYRQTCRTCPVDSPTQGSIVFTSEWINPNSFQYSGFILQQKYQISSRKQIKSTITLLKRFYHLF